MQSLFCSYHRLHPAAMDAFLELLAGILLECTWKVAPALACLARAEHVTLIVRQWLRAAPPAASRTLQNCLEVFRLNWRGQLWRLLWLVVLWLHLLAGNVLSSQMLLWCLLAFHLNGRRGVWQWRLLWLVVRPVLAEHFPLTVMKWLPPAPLVAPWMLR